MPSIFIIGYEIFSTSMPAVISTCCRLSFRSRLRTELAYKDSEHGEAAENLMRDYFLQAAEFAREAQRLGRKRSSAGRTRSA